MQAKTLMRIRLQFHYIPKGKRKETFISLKLQDLPWPEGLPTHPGDFKTAGGAARPEVQNALASARNDAQKELAGVKALRAPALAVYEAGQEDWGSYTTETECLFPVHREALPA